MLANAAPSLLAEVLGNSIRSQLLKARQTKLFWLHTSALRAASKMSRSAELIHANLESSRVASRRKRA